MSFGGGAPAAIPAPPTRSDAEVQEAALQERRRRANARGRASSILTSGQGVESAPTAKVRLLGN